MLFKRIFNSIYIKCNRFKRRAKPFFFLLTLFIACSNNVVFEDNKAFLVNEPLIEQFGAQLNYSDSGLVKLRIITGHLKDFSEDKTAPRQEFLDGFRVRILNKNNLESGHIKSFSAQRDLKTKTWTLTGGVEVIQVGGNKLYTERLNWDRQTKEFFTDSPVRIIDEGEEINGLGLRADDDLSEYTIFEVNGYFEGNIL